jgi:hypothetical protein
MYMDGEDGEVLVCMRDPGTDYISVICSKI